MAYVHTTRLEQDAETARRWLNNHGTPFEQAVQRRQHDQRERLAAQRAQDRQERLEALTERRQRTAQGATHTITTPPAPPPAPSIRETAYELVRCTNYRCKHEHVRKVGKWASALPCTKCQSAMVALPLVIAGEVSDA